MLKSFVNKLTLTNCAYHIIQTTGAHPSWKFEVGMHNKTYSISYYENRAINFFLAVYDRNGNKRLLLLALNVFLFWNQNSSFVEIFPFLLFTGVIKTAFDLDIAEWYHSKHIIHGSWYLRIISKRTNFLSNNTPWLPYILLLNIVLITVNFNFFKS